MEEKKMQNVVEEVATVTSAYSGQPILEETAIEVDNYGYISPDEVQGAIDDGTLVRCYHCDELIRYDDSHIGADNEFYCDDCFDSLFTTCERCGHIEFRDDMVTVHTGSYRSSSTEEWCESCAEDYAQRCEHCDEYFDVDEMYNVHGVGLVCGSCYDDYDYVRCEDCEEHFDREDCEYDDDSGCWFCHDCIDSRNRREAERLGLQYQRGDEYVIHGYHDYDYDIIFKGDRNRNKYAHFGTELEIDKGGENGTKARMIVNAGGYAVDTDIICMHDGSLTAGGGGVELISMPATLDYHRNDYNWPAMMAKAVELGYRSHDVNTCGLHVHVDREYFRGSMTNPEDAFCIMFTNNDGWLRAFSRRSRWDYCSFYNHNGYKFTVDLFKNKDYTVTQQTNYMLERMRNYYSGHGSALNFSNYGTIEVRLFKGTLKFATFIASLQLVEMLSYAAKHFRKEQLCNVGYHWFKKFAEKRGYTEYLEYLKQRAIIG